MSRGHLEFFRPLGDALQVTDPVFLQALRWSPHAPDAARAAARGGDVDAFVRAVREAPAFSAPVRSDAAGGVLWSRQAFASEPAALALADLLADRPAFSPGSRIGTRRAAEAWCERFAAALVPFESDARPEPLALLALLEALAAARDWPVPLFFRTWRLALTMAIRLGHFLDQAHAASELLVDQRLVVAGELPWQVGLLFAPVRGSERLARFGQRRMARALVKYTDSDGTPHAGLIERLPLWLASLVRATTWSDRCERPLWEPVERSLLRQVSAQCAPLCRPDGQFALCNGAIRDAVGVCRQALAVAGDADTSVESLYLRGLDRRKRPATEPSERFASSESPAASQSDWARLARLRTDWSSFADALVVAHDRNLPRIELTALGRLMLSGEWGLSLTLDGVPVPLEEEWSSVCWNSDSDADYLELQTTFEGGLRIERQALLARSEQFLLLADSVSGARAGRLELTSRLPLAATVTAAPDQPTREIVLQSGPVRARALPLALPQDRVLSTAGGFNVEEHGLTLRHVAQGTGLYAPLVIDWSPSRRRSPADWRTLTVTEGGSVVGRDVASGHRVRLGAHQLLIYRSLRAPVEARTVLGHHTHNETVVGRFEVSGEVEPILLVE